MNQPAALPPIAPQVRLILDGFARGIGVGNRTAFRWARTGVREVDLLGGGIGKCTARDLYGDLGRFSAECHAVAAVPVNNPYLQYELFGADGEDLRLTAGVELPGFAARLSPAHPQPVGSNGVEPVGAIGLTTIFSLLSVVWALLHPRVVLNLPGTIELDATLVDAVTLRIDFKTPPTVRCVLGVSFTCTPNSMTLKEHSVELVGKAGWFAKTIRREW